MQQKWPCPVSVAAKELIGARKAKTGKRWVRRESMVENGYLACFERARQDRIEYVLVAEVERIGEASPAMPAATDVHQSEPRIPRRQERPLERIGHEQLPGVDVRLSSQLPKPERRRPFRKESIVVRRLVDECDDRAPPGELDQLCQTSGHDDIRVEEDGDVCRMAKRRKWLQQHNRHILRSGKHDDVVVEEPTLFLRQTRVDDVDGLVMCDQSKGIQERDQADEMMPVARTVERVPGHLTAIIRLRRRLVCHHSPSPIVCRCGGKGRAETL